MLDKGTVIGSIPCSGCGAEKDLKINGKGNVFYFCADVVSRDENGKAEQCFTRVNLGRTASQKLINQYLQQERKNEDASGLEIGEEEENNGNGNSRDDRADGDNSGGGFIGGVKHFFTGDADE
jgi:ssDNA-binding Zn-finger/Zn-ribbon topoisomerase 1